MRSGGRRSYSRRRFRHSYHPGDGVMRLGGSLRRLAKALFQLKDAPVFGLLFLLELTLILFKGGQALQDRAFSLAIGYQRSSV
ncbi:MAG: hypothetical protein ACRCVD_04690, partial [Halioglobus sp.]